MIPKHDALALYDAYGHECFVLALTILGHTGPAETVTMNAFAAVAAATPARRMTEREALLVATVRACAPFRHP